MSRWQPCKRREFIRRLRELDFEINWDAAQIAVASAHNLDYHLTDSPFSYLLLGRRFSFNRQDVNMRASWKGHIVATPDVIRGKPASKGQEYP